MLQHKVFLSKCLLNTFEMMHDNSFRIKITAYTLFNDQNDCQFLTFVSSDFDNTFIS